MSDELKGDRAWKLALETGLAAGVDVLPEDEALVQRMAWAIHASRRYGSPRQRWAGMPVHERAQLYIEAAATLSVARQDFRTRGVALAGRLADEGSIEEGGGVLIALDEFFPDFAPHPFPQKEAT